MNFSSFYKLFLEKEEIVGPVYHGGKWDGVSPIKMGRGALGTGAYFTPNKELAWRYATEAGAEVKEAYLDIQKPIVIKSFKDAGVHPCVQALEILGMPKEKASDLVERIEENKGYLGKEISSRAIPQGYDGIFYYHNNTLREIVIWNSDKVINKL